MQSCPYCCIPAPSVSHFLFVSLLLGKPYFRATCLRQRTQKQGSELDDICPDCSEKFLGQSFSWSMFSPSLAVSFYNQSRGKDPYSLSRICRFYIGASLGNKVNCEPTVIALSEHEVMKTSLETFGPYTRYLHGTIYPQDI